MLYQEAPEYEQNFSMVMRVLEYAEVREDDDEYIFPVDEDEDDPDEEYEEYWDDDEDTGK